VERGNQRKITRNAACQYKVGVKGQWLEGERQRGRTKGTLRMDVCSAEKVKKDVNINRNHIVSVLPSLIEMYEHLKQSEGEPSRKQRSRRLSPSGGGRRMPIIRKTVGSPERGRQRGRLPGPEEKVQKGGMK